jgi:predicted small lipoprotein YifL
MKTIQLFIFFIIYSILTACGQIGPLYLPGTAPPIYVEHEQKIDTDQETVIPK